MGLEDGPVTQDRRDVKVVVFPTGGLGRVAATVTGYYQASGREAKYILTPGGGIRGDGTSLAAPLVPPIDDRRLRPARR